MLLSRNELIKLLRQKRNNCHKICFVDTNIFIDLEHVMKKSNHLKVKIFEELKFLGFQLYYAHGVKNEFCRNKKSKCKKFNKIKKSLNLNICPYKNNLKEIKRYLLEIDYGEADVLRQIFKWNSQQTNYSHFFLFLSRDNTAIDFFSKNSIYCTNPTAFFKS